MRSSVAGERPISALLLNSTVSVLESVRFRKVPYFWPKWAEIYLSERRQSSGSPVYTPNNIRPVNFRCSTQLIVWIFLGCSRWQPVRKVLLNLAGQSQRRLALYLREIHSNGGTCPLSNPFLSLAWTMLGKIVLKGKTPASGTRNVERSTYQESLQRLEAFPT